MKKRYFLPMEEPKFICYHHLICANSIISANAKDKTSIIMTSKYINCYYKEESTKHKFVISIYDHWCTAQKVMQNQSINFLKETYKNQKINIVSTIKKFLVYNLYVFGQCNRSYLELIEDKCSPLFYYVISGFDDITNKFTIHGLDMMDNYLYINIDYKSFVDALFDTPNPNIAFTLWRYNKDILINFDLPNIIFELEDYVNSTNRRNHYTADKEYGLKAIEKLAYYLKESAQQEKSINEFYLKKLLVHKNYMKERIECLSQHNIIDSKWLPYAEKVLSLTRKILDNGYSFNVSCDFSMIEQMMAYLNETIEIEKVYLLDVLDELKAQNNQN